MKVWNISELDIQKAADKTSVEIRNFRTDGRAFRFTLGLSANKKWQRVSASIFQTKADGEPRKVNAVCWHGHYHFMRALFAVNENARIKTAWRDYRGLQSFLEQAPSHRLY